MEDILFAPITEVSRLYRSKAISPVEVLEATFQHLQGWEPHLNAFVSVWKETALASARHAENAFMRGNADTLPSLLGIPISVKDLIYTKGLRTSCGSHILRDFQPDFTASLVTRLERSGAVIIGKTNLLEFAYGVPHPDYGPTQNPWDDRRTSGGSSGGSAASVAAGIGYASIGTDTGGSVRIPASYCGVVGLKPTYGRVSTWGVFPLAWSLDHVGLLARHVDDAGEVLAVLAGYDANDSHSDDGLPVFCHGSIECGNTRLRMRIGVPEERAFARVRPDVYAHYQRALTTLQLHGFELVELGWFQETDIEVALMRILLPEAAYVHRRWLDRKDDYAPQTYRQLEEGGRSLAMDYLHGLDFQTAFRREVASMFADVDAILTPTVCFPAPQEDPVIGDESENELTFTGPFNVSGHPALTANAGFTAEGLPVGVQVVGPYGREDVVLAVARVLETIEDCRRRPEAPR
ncbi:MAG: amidase [Bacilli bacterium]